MYLSFGFTFSHKQYCCVNDLFLFIIDNYYFICAMAYLSLWMTIGLFLILVHYKDFVKVCTQVCVWALACVFPD